MGNLLPLILLIALFILALAVAVLPWVTGKTHGGSPSPIPSPVNKYPFLPYNAEKTCKAATSSCLNTDANSKDCQLIKSDRIQPFFGYKIDLVGTDPSVAGMDCGFSYDKDKQVCVKNGKNDNWNNGRPVWVYFPNSVLEKGSDIGSIPYVIYYSFTQWNTTDLDAESLASKGYGLFNPDRVQNCTTVKPCDDAPMSPIWMQLQLQGFLSSGYAVVLTTMIADDSYMYMETCPAPPLVDSPIYNLCWNKGDNADCRYMAKFFDLIRSQSLFTGGTGTSKPQLIPSDPTLGKLHPGASSFLTDPGVNLATDECGLIGYSVGAQMVSRSINEFANPGGPLAHAPRVAVACMVSGGSLYCYQYCDADSGTARGLGGSICKAQPDNWGPCWNRETLGCCPEGLTEPRYDKGEGEEHPPVILVQTDLDYFADPRASENYYRALLKMGLKSGSDTQIVHGMCGNHDLFPSAIFPVLHFFLTHMAVK